MASAGGGGCDACTPARSAETASPVIRFQPYKIDRQPLWPPSPCRRYDARDLEPATKARARAHHENGNLSSEISLPAGYMPHISRQRLPAVQRRRKCLFEDAAEGTAGHEESRRVRRGRQLFAGRIVLTALASSDSSSIRSTCTAIG